ncbi:MAG TPA: glutamyl-tRNA reductase [Lacibacter sp.]|jgi:glutamyl-tRNA reductase|nr:glutamyl-tRNA reductase [Lacibacter sp.]
MHRTGAKDISKFFIAGINYRKTDALIRGKFAVNPEQYNTILQLAPDFAVHEFFLISTCNRTEIYGFADEADQLIRLLCTQTDGTAEQFRQLSYIKQGQEAINHLFTVGGGLDSQILGDYEIVGQIKQAAKLAKQHDRIDAFTERLVNCMLQSSKAIKNNTALSDGTVSVSFAAVQYIRKHVKGIKNKNILLLGTGKFGRNTCKNLVDYLGTKNITLINRTEEKATSLAEELGLRSAPLEDLADHINQADIILVATNATEPTILKAHLEGLNYKLIIDLSIPHNVEQSAKELANITLVNVDELSKLKDETLAKREAEVPKAKAIIAEHIAEFIDWYQMRKHVPVLKAVKTKLKEIHTSPLYITLQPHHTACSKTDEKIQRVINGMASKMKEQNQRGCYYIEAINEFIATGTD